MALYILAKRLTTEEGDGSPSPKGEGCVVIRRTQARSTTCPPAPSRRRRLRRRPGLVPAMPSPSGSCRPMLRGGMHRSLARCSPIHGRERSVAAMAPAYVLDSLRALSYLEVEPGMPTRSIHPRGRSRSVQRVSVTDQPRRALYITERERGLVAARRTLGAVDQLPWHRPDLRARCRMRRHHARFRISYADSFARGGARWTMEVSS